MLKVPSLPVRAMENGDGLAADTQPRSVVAPVMGPEATVTSLEHMDPLVMDTIFSFLDVRSLFRVSLCNKQVRKVLSFDHVVRAATLQGGHAKRTTEAMVRLLSQGRIAPPSPLRWLRLVNGRFCERMEDCVHQVRRGEPKRVNCIRPEFGLFVCQTCLHTLMTPPSSSSSNNNNNNSKKNPTMTQLGQDGRPGEIASKTSSTKLYTLYQPFYDSTGERAGPLHTITSVIGAGTSEQPQYYSPTNDCRFRVSDCQLNKINHVYQRASKDHNQSIQMEQQEGLKRKQVRALRRIHKYQRLLEYLRSSLVCIQIQRSSRDAGTWDREWIDILLDFDHDPPHLEDYADDSTESGSNSSSTFTTPRKHSRERHFPSFRCPLMYYYLRPFLSNPSKGTKKGMLRIATKVADDLHLLWSRGFYDFSFLDPYGDTATTTTTTTTTMHPFYTALQGHFQKTYLHVDVLQSPALTGAFFQLLRQNLLLEALQYFGRWTDTSTTLPPTAFGRFDEAFADYMVSNPSRVTIPFEVAMDGEKDNDDDEDNDEEEESNGSSNDAVLEYHYKCLARTLWAICEADEFASGKDDYFMLPVDHKEGIYLDIFERTMMRYQALMRFLPSYERFVENEARELFEGAEDVETEVEYHVQTCCDYTWTCPRAVLAFESTGYHSAYAEAWLAYQLSQWD